MIFQTSPLSQTWIYH